VTAAGWRAGYADRRPEKLAELPVERWRHEVGIGLKRPVGDAFTLRAEIDGSSPLLLRRRALPRADLRATPRSCGDVRDPGHWRQGAGEALMSAAMERLSELPYEEAVLWTFRRTSARSPFYEHHGWLPDGTEKIHARTGEPLSGTGDP